MQNGVLFCIIRVVIRSNIAHNFDCSPALYVIFSTGFEPTLLPREPDASPVKNMPPCVDLCDRGEGTHLHMQVQNTELDGTAGFSFS